MREVLINNNTFHERGVLDATSSLGNHLDEIKVHVLSLNISNGEHCLDSDVGEE